jgi:hypothetical protein
LVESWKQQEGETDEWFARFTVYLSLGYGRSLLKAYRMVYPESSATEVSATWREEFRTRRWRSRVTDFELTLFQSQARETAVLMGRGMRAFARKTLRALLAKGPAMQPTSWEEAAKGFEVLLRMLPSETIVGMVKAGDDKPTAGKARHEPEDFDSNGFLKDASEGVCQTPTA